MDTDTIEIEVYTRSLWTAYAAARVLYFFGEMFLTTSNLSNKNKLGRFKKICICL